MLSSCEEYVYLTASSCELLLIHLSTEAKILLLLEWALACVHNMQSVLLGENPLRGVSPRLREKRKGKEKAMAPHSSTLAWKIPWTEEPGRLQSMGLLGVGHD